MRLFNLCFTGISGSGKTTLANMVSRILIEKGIKVQIIDGDDTRREVGCLFGHTREERMKMNQINRLLAKYLNNNEINTIIAIVAPFHEMRANMRNYFADSYIEVYLKCSEKTCRKRDVKGYYKLEEQGKISHLNGVNDIFEVPEQSEIVIDTENESVEQATQKIVSYLMENGYAV